MAILTQTFAIITSRLINCEVLKKNENTLAFYRKPYFQYKKSHDTLKILWPRNVMDFSVKLFPRQLGSKGIANIKASFLIKLNFYQNYWKNVEKIVKLNENIW